MDKKKQANAPARVSDYETLMMGMEAIGDLLTVAGGNENQTLQPYTIAKAGELLRYLAVEADRLSRAG